MAIICAIIGDGRNFERIENKCIIHFIVNKLKAFCLVLQLNARAE